MHVRRLVKAGEASHTISLPKSWLERNNLAKGDAIYINETPNNELTISADKKEVGLMQKEITINVEDKDIGTIQREITSAYINNFNTITILGKQLGSQVKDIRKTIHDFVALEIVEQTSTKIVAKDLLNLQEINLTKTIRRMDMIVRSMFTDSIESIGQEDVSESISYRDYDVNRLYFLMYRLMKGTLEDVRVAESFNIKNSEALATWYLAMNIETLADSGKAIASLLPKVKKKVQEDVKSLYSQVEKGYLDAIKAYYTKDKSLADSVAHERGQVASALEAFMQKNSDVTHIALVREMTGMLNNISNIARVVIDFAE